MNRFEAGACNASLVRFGGRGARRKAEDNGTNLGKQPPVFAPGNMINDVQVSIFKRHSRLPTRPRRSLITLIEQVPTGRSLIEFVNAGLEASLKLPAMQAPDQTTPGLVPVNTVAG